eukprot:5928839-Pyramimonas_sp.AAC.1
MGINANSRGSLLDYLDAHPLGTNVLAFVQEHKLTKDYIGEVSASCFDRHLAVGLAQASTGPGGGRVAGV